jgi:hypothetical protein
LKICGASVNPRGVPASDVFSPVKQAAFWRPLLQQYPSSDACASYHQSRPTVVSLHIHEPFAAIIVE